MTKSNSYKCWIPPFSTLTQNNSSPNIIILTQGSGNITVPKNVNILQYIVVGGGGGGGAGGGSGGGGGGGRSDVEIGSVLLNNDIQTVTYSVGTGGVGADSFADSENGQDSFLNIFDYQIIAAGGQGGNYNGGNNGGGGGSPNGQGGLAGQGLSGGSADGNGGGSGGDGTFISNISNVVSGISGKGGLGGSGLNSGGGGAGGLGSFNIAIKATNGQSLPNTFSGSGGSGYGAGGGAAGGLTPIRGGTGSSGLIILIFNSQ